MTLSLSARALLLASAVALSPLALPAAWAATPAPTTTSKQAATNSSPT